MDQLNIQGSNSISIPFPPFTGKEAPPPPPPPSALTRLPCGMYHGAQRILKEHPYAIGAGAALAMSVGVGLGAAHFGYGGRFGKALRSRSTLSTRGEVQDGMLKEAIGVSFESWKEYVC